MKLLEAARKQGLYTQVLEALLAVQPEWADHAKPDIGIAFKAVARAGLRGWWPRRLRALDSERTTEQRAGLAVSRQ